MNDKTYPAPGDEAMINGRRFVVVEFDRVVYPQRGSSMVRGYYLDKPNDPMAAMSYTYFIRHARPVDDAALAAHFQANPLPDGPWKVVRYIDPGHVEIQRVVSVRQLHAWSRSKSG